MKKISSNSTWWFKWGMPSAFLAFLMLVVIMGWRQGGSIALLIAPIIMGGVMWVMLRQKLFDLVDEVWDQVDALVVRHRGIETRIDLSNITNITDMTTANWPRVTLHLRLPCQLGDSISFAPQGGGSILSRGNPIALDLIRCVDAARQKDPAIAG